MIFKFFDKKSRGSGIKSMPNPHLRNDLHKPNITKFERGKFYASYGHMETTFGVLIWLICS